MCVRTKTSYDCGHIYKTEQSCHRRSCGELDRYHFKTEGDCRRCREGGDAITRGREGKGRYAQEMFKKETRLHLPRVPLSATSSDVKDGPWAPASRREKPWRSPIRKQADAAWEDEHSRRKEDLQSRSAGSKTGSDHSDEDRLPSPTPHHRRRDSRADAIREEIRKLEDAERIRLRRRRDYPTSHESFRSYGGSRQSSYGSGMHHHPDGHYSAGSGSRYERSHSSHRSRAYDSGFASSPKPMSYNLYNTESYFSGLGYDVGGRVWESGRRWVRW